MIRVIGSEERCYYIGEVAKQYEEEIKYSGYITKIEQSEKYILDEEYAYIIIDITTITDTTEEITNFLKRIRKVVNGKIIILAQGYEKNTSIINELMKNNFKNYLLEINLSKQKQDLKDIIEGKKENKIKEEKKEVFQVETELRTDKEKKSVAVLGSMERIGVTTLAINYVKYLMYKGYKACYIEMNEKGYIEKLKKFYEVEENEKLGYVKVFNVEMYYKKERIKEILEKDYDYYVYDYGHIKEENKKNISFLEKDINIIVGGVKPNEMGKMTKAIKIYNEKEINYVFNFCDEYDKKEILELMEEQKEKTYFLNNTVNPFIYIKNNNTFFEKITTNVKEEKKENKKKKIFSFLKGKNKRGENNE